MHAWQGAQADVGGPIVDEVLIHLQAGQGQDLKTKNSSFLEMTYQSPHVHCKTA